MITQQKKTKVFVDESMSICIMHVSVSSMSYEQIKYL